MPSARAMAFSAALLLPQVSQVSSVMVQMFSAAECKPANVKLTQHMPEDVCSPAGAMFQKISCGSGGAVTKYYIDKDCKTADAGASDQTLPIGTCVEYVPGAVWAKGTCGMGEAIKIEKKSFSDKNCATLVESESMYLNTGCTGMSEYDNSKKTWTPRSMMMEESTSTVKMRQYAASADCTGTNATSEATCNMCLPDDGADGKYMMLSTGKCNGKLGGVSAGTRSSPLALVAIAVIAFLAR